MSDIMDFGLQKEAILMSVAMLVVHLMKSLDTFIPRELDGISQNATKRRCY